MSDPEPAPGVPGAPGVPDEVGTCRGEVARQAEAGVAAVDWVPLSTELPQRVDVVFRATGIEDGGARDIYDGEEGTGLELPRAARFSGVTELVGEVGDPVEELVSEFQLSDAEVLLEEGAELLVWLGPRLEDDPRFAGLVAVSDDGGVVFLGDCRPKWTPAFADYVEGLGSDTTAGELFTRMVTSPEGPEAVAFRTSAAAATPAGP